jgi:hypothetical protein
MRWKAPVENLNTGHAVAEDVRDTKQLMPSCIRQLALFVV